MEGMVREVVHMHMSFLYIEKKRMGRAMDHGVQEGELVVELPSHLEIYGRKEGVQLLSLEVLHEQVGQDRRESKAPSNAEGQRSVLQKRRSWYPHRRISWKKTSVG